MQAPLVPTIAARSWPGLDSRVRDLLLIVAGSLFVAALAQVRIPLPFTPVPLTGQTFAVLLVGAALGSRRGAASLLLYLAEGLLGLPFFAGGGSGLAYLSGPTGGYLVGFVLAAGVVGWLAEKVGVSKFLPALLIFLAGELVIFSTGVLWLGAFLGLPQAFAAGFLPFVIGDLIKMVAAALALPAAWKLLRGGQS
ncbi:biotin transporter BioY [bacterium]|nr:biotin transporter BioY [bacterium]